MTPDGHAAQPIRNRAALLERAAQVLSLVPGHTLGLSEHDGTVIVQNSAGTWMDFASGAFAEADDYIVKSLGLVRDLMTAVEGGSGTSIPLQAGQAVLINPKLDALIDAVDGVTERVGLTNGDHLFGLTLLLIGRPSMAAGVDADARQRILSAVFEALRTAPFEMPCGQVIATPAMAALRDMCEVEVAPVAIDEGPDEEMVPHAFVPRSSGAEGDDREVWCTDCEYHRDHPVHAAVPGAAAPGTLEQIQEQPAVHLFTCPQHGQFSATRPWTCGQTVASCPGCNAEMREWNEVTNKDGRLGPAVAPRLHRCVCRSAQAKL